MDGKKKKQAAALLGAFAFGLFALFFYLGQRPDSFVHILSEAGADSVQYGSSPAVDASVNLETAYEAVAGPFYLVGEVADPGIYIIEPGQHLYEIVDLAGGLTALAARERINLAQAMEPGGMFRIPSIHDEPDSGSIVTDHGKQAEEPSKEPGSPKLLGINSATVTDLVALPGVGPATAEAIVSLRESQGGFKVLEDIMLVPGIKEKRFEQIKAYIYLD